MSGSGHDTPRRSGRIYRMSGSGRDALPNVRERSEGPPRCPGVVGRASRMSRSGQRPYWMSGSCSDSLPGVLKDLPNVQKDLPDIREW